MDTQNKVTRSVTASCVKSWSASQRIAIFITRLNNPKVSIRSGQETSFNIGLTRVLRIVSTAAAKASDSKPPVKINPEKYFWAIKIATPFRISLIRSLIIKPRLAYKLGISNHA